MNWYRGNIAEAVAQSKMKNAIFVVYVEGKDETTKKLSNFINEEKIREKLESEDFVAIKIESDSQAYMQFATIYQVVPVPSIFFIGKSGTPLEIGTGIIASAEELAQKINKVLVVSGQSSKPTSTSTSFITAEQEASNSTVGSLTSSLAPALTPDKKIQPSTSTSTSDCVVTEQSSEKSDNIVCHGDVCYKKPKNDKDGDVAKRHDEAESAADNEIEAEARLAEARKKLEQQRRERIEEESRLEKEREQQRRRESREMQNHQQWQRETELKELKDNIRREKMEEQAARDRIRAQIAADRAERAQKFSMGSDNNVNTANVAATSSVATKSVNSGDSGTTTTSTRIQFRFASGENSAHIFDNQATLINVREHVRTSLLPGTGIKEFTLATTYPKRELNSELDTQTLVELGLFPSAVILIIGKESTTNPAAIIARSGGLFNIISTLVMTILSPVIAIFGYFKNMATGGDGRQTGNEDANSSAANKRANEERGAQHEAAKRRNLERFGVTASNESNNAPSTSDSKTDNNEPKPYRRYGSSNIHRLTDNRKDSDDENATWNGNSTQQQ